MLQQQPMPGADAAEHATPAADVSGRSEVLLGSSMLAGGASAVVSRVCTREPLQGPCRHAAGRTYVELLSTQIP